MKDPSDQRQVGISMGRTEPVRHLDSERTTELTHEIIGSAMEVHRDKGPGLIESIYEWCLTKECELRGISWVAQKSVEISYKGFRREDMLRFDLLVEGEVLVEVKSVEKVLPIHLAQLLSYMKLLNVPVGLLINFNEIRLIDGVRRLYLPSANQSCPCENSVL